MKIMRLCCGMANTMFQYATYLQLKKMYPNEQIFVDTMWFDVVQYPYDLKKAFNLDVRGYDFYEFAKRENKLDYQKEFEKIRRWKKFGYDSWYQMMNGERSLQGKTSEQDFPELYLKAGYNFDIILTYGYTLKEVYQILQGELQTDKSLRQKIKKELYQWFGEFNNIFMYERVIRVPYKRHKLITDLMHGKKPDFSGAPPVSRLLHEGDAFYCTYGNENDLSGIEDEVRQVFTFVPFTEENNIRLADDIAEHESVAIHARVSQFEYGMASAVKRNYYKKAVKYLEKKIGKNLKYYIFSDCPQWVRSHLDVLGMDDDKNYVIVDNNNGEKAFRDMQLMSLCKHNICAQSTFSWWAGFLNQYKDKIVITPYETFPGTISF